MCIFSQSTSQQLYTDYLYLNTITTLHLLKIAYSIPSNSLAKEFKYRKYWLNYIRKDLIYEYSQNDEVNSKWSIFFLNYFQWSRSFARSLVIDACQTNSCLDQSLMTHLSFYLLHTLSTHIMYLLLYNYLPFTCTSLKILHKLI